MTILKKYKPKPIKELSDVNDVVYHIMNYCLTTDELRYGYEYIPKKLLSLCRNDRKLYYKVMDSFCNSKQVKLFNKKLVASYFADFLVENDRTFEHFFKKKYALSKTLYYIDQYITSDYFGGGYDEYFAKKFIKLYKKANGNVSYDINKYFDNSCYESKLKLYIHNFNLDVKIKYYDFELNKLIAIYF